MAVRPHAAGSLLVVTPIVLPLAAASGEFASGGVVRWLVFLLLFPGLAALVGVVLMYALRGGRKRGPTDPAPGYYHVLGIDRATGAKRESTFHAATEQSARGRAALGGVIVTEVRRVNETEPNP